MAAVIELTDLRAMLVIDDRPLSNAELVAALLDYARNLWPRAVPEQIGLVSLQHSSQPTARGDFVYRVVLCVIRRGDPVLDVAPLTRLIEQ